MDLYTKTAYISAKALTNSYSTSFSLSSRLFAKDIRHHIYAIYGLARIADEIVDTYRGKNAAHKLSILEEETYSAAKDAYSANPIVHAFANTAIQYGIQKEIITAFFISMRMDLSPQNYNDKLYKTYIYGSAEVIGLMCLRVFSGGNDRTYNKLAPGAKKLGSAYQKVNFLRDLSADYKELGRLYFPGVSYESLSQQDKEKIVQEIRAEFEEAGVAIKQLPKNSRAAVTASFRYYRALLHKIEVTSVEELKASRIRINDARKLFILSFVYIKSKLGLL